MSVNQIDLVKVKDEIKTNLDRLQEDSRNFNREMKSSQNDYSKNIEMIKKTFETTLLGVIKEFESLIGPLEARKDQVLKQDVDHLRTKLKESVQFVNTKLQQENKSFSSEIERVIRSSTDNLKDKMKTVSNHVDTVYSSEESAIELIRESLMNSTDRAKEIYSNVVKQRIESVRSATVDMLDDVEVNLKNFKEGSSSVTKGSQDEIDALMREIIIEVESSYERNSASLRDIMLTIENNIKETFTTKETEFKEISEKLVENISKNVNENSTSLSKSQGEVRDLLSKFTTEEGSNIASILDNINNSFIDAVKLTENTSTQEFQNTSDYFKNKLYSSMNSATKEINLFYDQTILTIDGMISELSKSKSALESNKEKYVTGSINNLADIGKEMESSFHSMVQFLKSNFEKDKTKIQNKLESKITTYNTDFSSRLSELESNIMKSFSNSSDTQTKIIDENIAGISGFASDHTGKAKSTFSNLTQEVRKKMDDFIDDQKRLSETSSLDIQKKLQENQSEIISKLESLPPQIISIGDTFNENRQTKFSQASSEMDNAIDLFERELNDWAGDLNSIIGQEVASVQKNVDERRKESTELFSKTGSNLTASQTSISNNIETEVNSISSELNERFDEIGGAVTANIDLYVGQFDGQITKFIEKGSQQSEIIAEKARNFQDQSTKFKESSQESFEKLETTSKFQTDLVLKSGEKLVKTIESTIVASKKPS